MNDTVISPSGKELQRVDKRTTTHKNDSEAKALRVASRQNTRRTENLAYLNDPNVKAFLETIADTEGGDYDFMYGAFKGKKNDPWRIKDFSTHPGPGWHGKITAAGKYQITKETWEGLGGQAMGLKDFSPQTQDLIAIEILRIINAIDGVVAGDMPAAIGNAAKRWNSLPMGKGLTNRVTPQPYTKYEDVVKIFKAHGGSASKE